MRKYLGKKGFWKGAAPYMILVMIVLFSVIAFSVPRLQAGFRTIDRPFEECLRTKKTVVDYQTEVVKLLAENKKEEAAKAYDEFYDCFEEKELEFEEDELFALAEAEYEQNNFPISRYLFTRYKSEFSDGKYFRDIRTFLDKIDYEEGITEKVPSPCSYDNLYECDGACWNEPGCNGGCVYTIDSRTCPEKEQEHNQNS